MDEEDKVEILMDNERNLAIFSTLGLALAYIGINFPFKLIWVFPVIFTEIAAVVVTAYGVFRYLERREMTINDDLEFLEKRW